MNMNVLAVDINTMSVYDFLRDGETEKDLLSRANQSRQKDIDTWFAHCKNYPDTKSFKDYLLQAEKKQYKIMTFEALQKMERDFYLNTELKEVTEEDFEEMLCVLPPLKHCTRANVEMFCLSERYSGPYTNQYAHNLVTGKSYTKMVDCTDESTWIHNYLN